MPGSNIARATPVGGVDRRTPVMRSDADTATRPLTNPRRFMISLTPRVYIANYSRYRPLSAVHAQGGARSTAGQRRCHRGVPKKARVTVDLPKRKGLLRSLWREN